MIDPFELKSAPLGEPMSIVIGQSHQWRRTIDIDSTDYTLQYVMRRYIPDTSAFDQTIDMTGADLTSGVWGVDIAPADISDFDDGRFFWDLLVTRVSDSRSKVIDCGEMTVFADDADRRTHAQLMLDKIESLLLGKADDDVASYTIKSRSINKMSPDELRNWREYYRREVANVAAATPGIFDQPRTNPSTLRVRFTD